MERDIPDQGSHYAAEGTAAHALAEKCLIEKKKPYVYLGETFEGFEATQEMINAVDVYTDFCSQFLLGEHIVERKLDLPFLGKGTQGTADFIAVKDGVLHVVDYKHGQGVAVEAKGNIQGLCYGLGATKLYDHLDWCKLRITIVQPRAQHPDGPIRSWDVSRHETLDYMMEFLAAARETEKPDAELRVGEHCRFCKAKPTCPAQRDFVAESAQLDFDEASSKPVPIDYLSDEQVYDLVFNRVKLIEQWCQSLKDYVQHRAETGEPIPGTKLVHTRMQRYWADEGKAEEVFGNFEGAYERKFKSVAKIEKIVGKQRFEELSGKLVDKKASGVTVVPESDPRPNARPSAEDEFDAV
jgi:hypothetical protein